VVRRRSPTDPQRRLYTERMLISPDGTLSIDQATGDRPIPAGVAPYSLRASKRSVVLRAGSSAHIAWQVDSADGVAHALANPLNRVVAAVADPAIATIQPGADGGEVVGHAPGRTKLTLTYQRRRAAGDYFDVFNAHRSVSVTIPIRVTP
jgi:hypothetical protein